jgi:putative transposase
VRQTSYLPIFYVQVREMVIGERAGKRPSLPEHVGKARTDVSRLLAGAEEKTRQRYERQAPAVSYRKVNQGDGHA